MRRPWHLLLSMALPALAPGLALAQLTGEQAVGAAAAHKQALAQAALGGELMFGKIGEDIFIRTLVRFSYDTDKWGLGLGVPLSLRIIDNDPQDGSFIRKEDWDEPADFFRLLRYVYIGDPSKTGPFYVRLGELSGLTIGHGTIVHRYYNGFDLNRYRLGTNIALNIGAFGVDAVVGDLVRPTDPTVVGFRFQVKPLLLFAGGEEPQPNAPAEGEGAGAAPPPSSSGGPDGLLGAVADRLALGFSLLVDPTAPFELKTDAGKVVVNTRGDPDVARQRTLVVTGFDIGYELLRGAPISITPYIDFNMMSQVEDGFGFHAGVLWGLRVPMLIDTFTVDLRTEYRRVSGDYLSPYFNSTYEVERFQAPPGSTITKLSGLASLGGSPGKNGAFFDLLLGFPSYVFIGGEYINYDGNVPDGSIRLSLEVPALEFVQFSAFYYRINIDGAKDMFKLDDRSAIVAEAKVPLYSIFSVNLRWWRLWRPDADGGYGAVDDWSVGVGFNIPL